MAGATNKKEVGLLIVVVLKGKEPVELDIDRLSRADPNAPLCPAAEHLPDLHRFSQSDPLCRISLTNSLSAETKVDTKGGQHPGPSPPLASP